MTHSQESDGILTLKDDVAIGVTDEKTHPPRVLTFWSLFAIAYFLVSGGPYGIENAVAGGPPVAVLLLFVFLPFLWSYPIGMITAELSNVYSQDGGVSVWVQNAFGESASLSVGIFSWFANMIDLSLYPVLFVQYFGNCFLDTKYANSDWGGNIENCFYARWILSFIVILLIVGCNLWGVQEVGKSANILAVVLLLPFVIMVLMGIWHVDFKMIIEGQHGFKGLRHVDISTIILPVVWSFSGYDSMGQLAGEVIDSHKNYPRGVMAVLIVSIVTYVLPVIVGMQYVQDWQNWVAGEFSTVALKVGGIWLNIFMGIGGMASSLGLFNCCLCTVSRNLYSLGERGYLPHFYSKLVPKRGTPWVAICTNAIIVGFLVILPFNSILSLDMSTYSIVIFYEVFAYIKLFLYHKDLNRPFKAITTNWGIPLMASPLIFAFLVVYSAGWDTQWKLLIVVGLNIFIVGMRLLYKNHREKILKGLGRYKEENKSLLGDESTSIN